MAQPTPAKPEDKNKNPNPPKEEATESKSQRFSRVATARLLMAKKYIELLGNCANKATYEYTPQQVATMKKMLSESLANTIDGFEKGEAKVDAGFKL